mmetsp:Transcript_35569/g.65857  ORF Transcript_35569/g.65857 Transcript_35569/m.65857 type:complete len:526 (+) Transcript_35569:66-1643(+)
MSPPCDGAKNQFEQKKMSFRRLFDEAFSGYTACERRAISKLAAAHQDLHIEDGYISHDGNMSLVRDFLKEIDQCAPMLKAEMTSRSYRQNFTANYRMILPSCERHYLPDILAASASRSSEGFLCVNGDMHVLTSECRRTSQELRSSLIALGDLLNRWATAEISTQKVQVRKEDVRVALTVFDKAWVAFEKEYVNTLIQVEAKSRAPLIQAITLEKFIETSCGFVPLEQFLDCLSNLTAKIQQRHRRTSDKLDSAVLLSAKNLTDERGNRVTAVLASGVVESFEAIRKYLQTVEKQIEHTHPDLHLNPGLVEVINTMQSNWRQFEEWGRIGSPNLALNCLVGAAKRAADMVPGFRDMCEECDPELFLVLPRILLVCFLNNTSAFQHILKKFLPAHASGMADVCKQHRATSLQTHGKLEDLRCKYTLTTEMLRGAMLEGTTSDVIFDTMIHRAVLGTSYDEQHLYASIQLARQAEASSRVDSFMLELEGWSLELQRLCPEAWNEFTSLFVHCMGDEKPCAKSERFHV